MWLVRSVEHRPAWVLVGTRYCVNKVILNLVPFTNGPKENFVTIIISNHFFKFKHNYIALLYTQSSLYFHFHSWTQTTTSTKATIQPSGFINLSNGSPKLWRMFQGKPTAKRPIVIRQVVHLKHIALSETQTYDLM